ncbi:MAG: O-antigen ligase family protein [Meiothermus sp.]|nr:O-antigen ligase family protein [Meiothermus sp.]
MIWVIGALFVFLPLYPLASATILVGFGFFSLCLRRDPMRWGVHFLLFGLLGAIAQLFSPSLQATYPSWLAVNSKSDSVNIIPFNGMADVRAWNVEDNLAGRAIQQSDGFWRIYRVNPSTNRPIRAIFSARSYPVQTGQTYTQSVYVRHNGTELGFDFYFTTARGQSPVTASFEPINTEISRAFASYTVRPGDNWLRAIDLAGFSGDWNQLDLAYPQLEEGRSLSPYQAFLPLDSLWQRFAWWVGTALLVFFAFHGSLWVWHRLKANHAANMLLLGLAIHLVFSLIQAHTNQFVVDNRVGGLAVQPNFLGHQSVLSAALAWMLGGVLPGATALSLSAGLVWLSGSRAALIALGIVTINWWTGLNRSIRWISFAVGMIGLFGVWLGNIPLGRLGDLAVVDLSRIQIWEVALNAIRSYPIGGIGQGAFAYFYYLELPPNALERLAPHAHSLILQVGVESGILGIIGFIQLYGLFVVKAVSFRNWPAVIVFLVIGILNILDSTFFYAGIHYAFWITAGWVVHNKPAKL